MSKNLTLKGAAFGALVALSISAVAPASAAGLADTSFVSLTPKTGTEYSVLAGAGKTFTLTANEASTIVGGDVKHLVTDASDLITTTSATTARTFITLATSSSNDTSKIAHATDTVTITDTSNSGSIAAADLAVGDVISFAADVTNAAGTIAAGSTPYAITAISTNTFSFVSATSYVTGLSADITVAANLTAGGAVSVIREARNTTDHTFVVDSGVHTSATNEDLVLVSDSDVTRSVTVQTWVDSNDNDVIDTNEYASPVRTVKFVKTSEVVASTTLVAPVVGDELLTAKITTVPVLNGEQVEAQDGSAVFGAYFTRQDSTSTGKAAVDGDSTWSDTTKTWTTTVDLTVATNEWAGLTNAAGLTPASAVHTTTGVVLVTTSADHNLRVGDKVAFGSITSTTAAVQTALRAGVTIATTPSARTFTVSQAATSTLGGTLTYTVETYTGNESITDRVFVGTYSAQAAIGATKLGAVATATAGASTSADSTLSIAGSSSVQAGEFSAVADGNNVQVKKATTSVAVSVAVIDADDAAVSAGRPVVISLGAPNEGAQSGTFKINGLTAPQTLLTDGSGKVSFTVSEATGVDTAQVRVTATPEGLSDAASSVDLIWNAADYKLYDLATNADGYLEGRSIDANGSLVLKLAYLDQWNSAPADGAYRLLVENAGNTVSSNYVSLASGRATVTIADNQIGAGSVIDTDITVQSKDAAPATTWTNETADSWVDAGLGDLAIAVVAAQTAKINLDADGASLYGSAAADLSDAVAAKKTVATDIRTSYVARPTYTNDVVVSGQVANAVTGLLRANASVTISGDSSILFRDGQVDAFGSLTFLADSSGKFAISAFSTKAAKDSVITVTSGGKSATVKVTFTAGAAETVSFAPVATSKEGRTIDLAVKFYDSYGNLTTNGAPQATFAALSGPGWLTNTAAVVAVDGVSSVKLVTQVGDTGLATVKVTTNVNDAAGDAITVTKSILIGVTAKITKAATSKATVKNANGLTVKLVRGTKSVTKTATSDSYKVSLKGGKGTVAVYVNGVKVASK